MLIATVLNLLPLIAIVCLYSILLTVLPSTLYIWSATVDGGLIDLMVTVLIAIVVTLFLCF